MANEYTLADYEAIASDNLNKAVIRTWREKSPILDMMSFKTGKFLSQRFVRFTTVPTIAWRKIGEDFTQTKVNPDSVEERTYHMGAKIDVPVEYVEAETITDLRGAQEMAVMEGVALGFNNAFFNNTPTDDEDAIVGLWYRLKNDLGSGQYFDASLDVSPDTAVTGVAHKFFDQLDQLLSLVDGENSQKVLFCGRTMWLRAQSLFRQSQLLDTTTDQLGRVYMTYGKGGAKLVDVGYKEDQSTTILGNVENGITTLTGGTDSSIYCVRFGEPYVAGWAFDMPMAEDVGMTEDRVNYRTVVKFAPGLYINHPRAAALAYGFTAA